MRKLPEARYLLFRIKRREHNFVANTTQHNIPERNDLLEYIWVKFITDQSIHTYGAKSIIGPTLFSRYNPHRFSWIKILRVIDLNLTRANTHDTVHLQLIQLI